MERCKCFKVHQWFSELFNKWDQDNKTSQQYASIHSLHDRVYNTL